MTYPVIIYAVEYNPRYINYIHILSLSRRKHFDCVKSNLVFADVN